MITRAAPSPIPIGTVDQWGRVWDGTMWRCPVGIPEAPADGRFYGRQNETWQLGVGGVNAEVYGDLTVDDNLFVTKNATVGEKLRAGCLVGVTDGSVASSSCVGEHLDVTTASFSIPASGTWATYSLLTLPPGDWHVQGSIQLDINIDYQTMDFGVYANGQTLGRFFISTIAGLGGGIYNTGVGHISVGTPTAVTAQFLMNYTETPSGTFNFETLAWRIR